jgi:hypothetical protein
MSAVALQNDGAWIEQDGRQRHRQRSARSAATIPGDHGDHTAPHGLQCIRLNMNGLTSAEPHRGHFGFGGAGLYGSHPEWQCQRLNPRYSFRPQCPHHFTGSLT